MKSAKSRIALARSFVSLIALSIPVLLSCYSGSGQGKPTELVHFPNARTSRDGEIWIKWNESRRQGFIDGYIQGRRQGYQKGCGNAEQILSQKGTSIQSDLLAQCLGGGSGFTAPLDRYQEEVTAFYEKYSADREIPMTDVLRFLSDEYNKTPEQIHKWYISYKSHDETVRPE